MKRSVLALVPIALVLGAIACSLVSPATPGPASPAPETPSVVPPTEPLPTATSLPEPRVVALESGNFKVYRLTGEVEQTLPAGGLQYVNPGIAQVVGDSIYYLDGSRHVVIRVSASGSQDLPFASGASLMAFTVSGDGSKIAWVTTTFGQGSPQSQLHLASIDGSQAKVVADTATNGGLDPNYVLQPYRFLPDGDLLYAWQISGIGGYILFFGYSSMYRYAVSSGQTSAVVAAPEPVGGPCWDATNDDASAIVGDCRGTSGVVGMRERQTASGAETVFPMLTDQGQAGAAAYSPSGNRLAYAVARGNPDSEFGQIAVRLAPGEAPKVIASQDKSYFGDILWVDEDRMIVQTFPFQGDQAKVELLTLDGARTVVGQGALVGLMP